MTTSNRSGVRRGAVLTAARLGLDLSLGCACGRSRLSGPGNVPAPRAPGPDTYERQLARRGGEVEVTRCLDCEMAFNDALHYLCPLCREMPAAASEPTS